MDRAQVSAAARAVADADAVVVTAGAGMGVDSGLPDFRGDEGFWNAYPPYRDLGRSFTQLADPIGFLTDARSAWGFYGHRRALYRSTTPHDGFAILSRWVDDAPGGGFVVTSNVDLPRRRLRSRGRLVAARCGTTSASTTAVRRRSVRAPTSTSTRPPCGRSGHCRRARRAVGWHDPTC